MIKYRPDFVKVLVQFWENVCAGARADGNVLQYWTNIDEGLSGESYLVFHAFEYVPLQRGMPSRLVWRLHSRVGVHHPALSWLAHKKQRTGAGTCRAVS